MDQLADQSGHAPQKVDVSVCLLDYGAYCSGDASTENHGQPYGRFQRGRPHGTTTAIL